MTFFDFLGFGALNVDKLFKVNSIATAEEESFVIDYAESCGGSAANTMVGLARLGCSCGFIGKVAEDREGKLLLENFCEEGIDIKGVTRAKVGRSGTVMGFVDSKGDRALYVDSGVNDSVGIKEIDRKYASGTKFVHLTSFVGEKPFKTQVELLSFLHERIKVSFDPGALYARLGLIRLEPIIKRAFVVMPNLKELRLLTGSVGHQAGAEILLEKGAKIVAVKLGKRGCYVASDEEKLLVEPFRVKVVDTTGAGDAFCAGFLYGLVKGKKLYDCGRIGNFVASRCITKMGARAGLPRLEDLSVLG